MWDKLTKSAAVAITDAANYSLQSGVTEVMPEHLLLGVLNRDGTVIQRLLGIFDTDVDRLRAEVLLTPLPRIIAERSAELSDIQSVRPRLSQASVDVLNMAAREAEARGDTFIGAEYILIALLAHGAGSAVEVLSRAGVTEANVRRALDEFSSA